MYFMYILQSLKDKKYYIGSSQNLEARLGRHNRGGVKSTAHRVPWVLIYQEAYKSQLEAVRREKEVKSYKGGNAFKKLISGNSSDG